MSDAAASISNCRNCNSALGSTPANFCAQCGQDTSLHAPSFLEFVYEFIGHYVALEGKLWRTLAKLFFLPGELTREYLRGRKQRYVLPLRLYLTASFIFFVLVKIIGGDAALLNTDLDGKKVSGAEVMEQIEKKLGEDQAQAAPGTADDADARAALEVARKASSKISEAIAARKAGTPSAATGVIKCGEDSRACAYLNERMQKRFGGMTLEQAGQDVKQRMVSLAPYAIFLLLPFYAGLLKLVYLGRGMYYGEHIVFALHLHAFLFFLLLAESAVPAAAKSWLLLLAPIYGAVAMQRTYGGRLWVTALRYIVVGCIYLFLILLVGLLLISGAVFF